MLRKPRASRSFYDTTHIPTFAAAAATTNHRFLLCGAQADAAGKTGITASADGSSGSGSRPGGLVGRAVAAVVLLLERSTVKVRGDVDVDPSSSS